MFYKVDKSKLYQGGNSIRAPWHIVAHPRKPLLPYLVDLTELENVGKSIMIKVNVKVIKNGTVKDFDLISINIYMGTNVADNIKKSVIQYYFNMKMFEQILSKLESCVELLDSTSTLKNGSTVLVLITVLENSGWSVTDQLIFQNANSIRVKEITEFRKSTLGIVVNNIINRYYE